MAKKVVISGYYGFKNFGDEAILGVLIDKLKAFDSNITVFSSNPDWTTETYSVSSVKSFDLKSVFKKIRESDILISGGGSLLQDVTSLKSLIYYSLIIFAALFYKKKVIIFAQGIGPINNPVARKIVMMLLKAAYYVCVRDENSLNLLKRYNINAELVCDPIYTLDVEKNLNKSGVGIQLRDFKTMNIDFINHLAMQVIKSFPDEDIKLFSLQDSLDLEVLKCFEHALKVISPDIKVEVISNLSNDELIKQIAGLEYIIAMRFHAVLTALKAGVKTLAINYDVKVEKLANESGIPLITLNNFSDFEGKFDLLKQEKMADIMAFTETKKFDWSNIEQILSGND